MTSITPELAQAATVDQSLQSVAVSRHDRFALQSPTLRNPFLNPVVDTAETGLRSTETGSSPICGGIRTIERNPERSPPPVFVSLHSRTESEAPHWPKSAFVCAEPTSRGAN